MSETIDVQILGQRNLNSENRSKHDGFKKAMKASIYKKKIYIWWETMTKCETVYLKHCFLFKP